MRIREKLINYQNEAEENFNNRKNLRSSIHYFNALFIFISSTLIAGLTMPVRFVIKSVSKQKTNLYIHDLNNQNIDRVLKKEGLVLIDFWANWCGPCVMMNPIIKDFAMGSKHIYVAKVNADFNKKMMDDFKVRGLPQFVLLKNGKEIKRHAGAMNLSALNEFCKE